MEQNQEIALDTTWRLRYGNNKGTLYRILFTGYFDASRYDYNDMSLRPVVMLKSNTELTEVGGVWQLSNPSEEPEEPLVPTETLASQVSSSNYGDYVEYNKDLNGDGDITNDWRIFYKESTDLGDDGTNIFLISADYLPNTWNENPTMTKSTGNFVTYCSYWDSAPSGLTLDASSKYMISKAGTFTSTNSTYQKTASLLTTSYWTNLVESTVAESAIGSPTVEMWMSSWNEIYPDDMLYCNNTDSKGYYVGTTTNPTTGHLTPSEMSVKEGYNNLLFYPHQTYDNLGGIETENCYGYALASPAAGNDTIMLYVYYRGNLGYYIFDLSYLGLRPVVCIKPETLGAKEDGVWKLKGTSGGSSVPDNPDTPDEPDEPTPDNPSDIISWEKLSAYTEFETQENGTITTSGTLGVRGTMTDYESTPIGSDKINVYVDGTLTTEGITVTVGEPKNIMTDGATYDITVAGFKADANQVRVEITEGNTSEKFILLNCLSQEIGSKTNYYSMEEITGIEFLSTMENATESIIDVSAIGDESIIAWFEGKLYIASNDEINAPSDSTYLFECIGYSDISTIDNFELLNTNNVTNMSGMFFDSSLESLNLSSNFDTSNVTDMSFMFLESSIGSLDLGEKFDTSNVTNMESMFEGLIVNTLNLGENFDTSNVTDMNNMFGGCGSNEFTSLDLGEKFDTSNVTIMENMFNNCGSNSLTSLDLGPAFKNISTNYFGFILSLGKNAPEETVIYCAEEIYYDQNNFRLNENSTTTIPYTRGKLNKKYVGPISSQITADNYGDYVKYNKDLNGDGDITNDWRIFYKESTDILKDGTNVFLIAADYLPNTWNENTMMIKSGGTFATYCASFKNYLPEPIAPVFMNGYMLSQATIFGKSNKNFGATTILFSDVEWENLVDSIYAEAAIGSPTVEMWMASWNEIYPDDMLYCNNADSTGYYVGTTTNPTSNDIDWLVMSAKAGYNNTLFYPHKTNDNLDGTEVGDCDGYWLTSPSAYDPNCLLFVQYDGLVYPVEYDVDSLAVRPIVCLKSETLGSQDLNNVWILSSTD